jgi:type I restriction enzyme, S subunit
MERSHRNLEDAPEIIAELERAHEAAGGHKRGNAAPPSDEAHDLSVEELPSSWRLREMRSAVMPDRPITYGILKPGPDTPNGVPYVRVADFPNDRLNLQTIRRTAPEIEKASARARFVKWFLRSPDTQNRMQKAVKGVAVRGINIGDVRALQLPVPPFAKQKGSRSPGGRVVYIGRPD